MSNELISSGNYSKIRNRMHSESDRAADLVALILEKVERKAQNYHVFIRVLEGDFSQYSDILSKLQQTYIQKQQGMLVNCTLLSLALHTLKLY